MNNFQLVNCDTDSIMISRSNGHAFSESEKLKLTEQLNDLFPKQINWELEEAFKKVIIVKAKNYIMQKENGELIIKGSALKASMKEAALKTFINDIINSLLEDKNDYIDIYNRYVKEILTLKDVKPWCSRRTITDKVLNAERTNEQKVLDAIEDSEFNEGDKISVFFLPDKRLCLVENFKGEYDKKTLLSKLYKTSLIFETIINKSIFKNYSLKKYEKQLEKL